LLHHSKNENSNEIALYLRNLKKFQQCLEGNQAKPYPKMPDFTENFQKERDSIVHNVNQILTDLENETIRVYFVTENIDKEFYAETIPNATIIISKPAQTPIWKKDLLAKKEHGRDEPPS